ncbi:hypothetical protein PV05_03442 [Exophiala xenobiotica]|uniref:Bromo domain-containing protein n=1 Tax=Exophiala xenobiotica TaxID=348802 RepID=A0A0D2D9J5_9EURO|nr:uncharacterized protein PV05_03442 [Exophiala xenobiotica]KIW58952.1 hypothetical protein PV05_03442 [Exophiala xenobiotica]
MDVEMQMEANGLPAHFSSTSTQPAENHVADNLAASLSNSDAPISLPSKPAVTESAPQSAPQSDPVFEATSQAEPEAVSQPPEALPPSTNGIGAAAEQSISTVPDSQPQPSLESNSVPPPTSLTDSMTDSVVPSSVPAEIQSSATPAETQPTMDFAEPVSAPPQPPESDLRTAPHSDALSPGAVAQVEAQKHQLDNSADIVPSPADANVMDISVAPDSANVIEQTPVTNLGLPSPPTHSPPDAPQPAPATLPEDKPIPSTYASETASVPTFAPEPEPQQILAPQSEPEAILAPERDMEQIIAPQSEPELIPSTEPRPQMTPTAAPAEKPKEPAPTPAVPATQLGEDQEMIDVVHAKQPRLREDDNADSQRAAKRVKTDESGVAYQEAGFKVPEVPMAALSPVPNGETPTTTGPGDGDDTVTQARLAHMKKVTSNLKKSNSSAPFRQPVDHVALNIPSYPDIVKQPMDLGTIDSRLKQNKYTSVSAFISDFNLIVDNCVKFNGPEHGITQQARKMESSFKSQMKNLPPATLEEPSKEIKKAAKKHEPTRQQAPRRPSVSTSSPAVATAAYASPKSAPPQTPSFAPGPDGMPLIRRDSSLADGRPKRAIVPTKRNQEFGGGRPKKKKYELQLKFCDEVLKDIAHPKNWQMNQYFTHPVDPVALNIPTYFQIIKKPMDLSTIRTKLTNNVYEKAKDFEEDVRLIFKNCYKFNPEGDLVNAAGHQLEDMFNKKWATKEEWIAAREPPSAPESDAEDEDDEEDESEEEAEDSEDERAEKIKLLQKQIEEMSKQMGELTQKKVKKSKSPPMKKSKSKPSKKEKPAAPKEGKDKKEKKKSAPKAKPEKDRYVTFAEKQYISNGIGMLPEKQMSEALKIIQNSVPSLANTDQNEIELDIEEVPNHALLKLLNFVKKYAGPPPDEPKAEAAENYSTSATKSKKSKPMSKHDQEAQIEELKGKLGAYVGPVSPNAMPSIEGDSSDDDGDSEESEEE